MAEDGLGLPLEPGAGLTPDAGEPLPRIGTAPLGRQPVPAPPKQPSPPKPAPPVVPAPSPGEPDTGAAPDLGKLAIILLVLAFILAAKAFTDLFNWLNRVTFGRLFPRRNPAPLDSKTFTQAAGAYLAPFIKDLDPDVGTSFHQSAITVGMLSRTLQGLAARMLKLATVIGALETGAAQSIQDRNALRKHQQVTEAQQGALKRQQQVSEKRAAQTSQHTETQVNYLTKYVADVIEPELERLRSRIPDLERGQATTAKQVDKHEGMLGLDAMVGTVAMSMARLGATWTRCDTNREVGEALCGANPDNVRNLLKGLLPLLGIAELCTLTRLIVQAGSSSLVADALGLFAGGIEGLLACTGATVAKPIKVPDPSLGPLQPWAALAPVNG